MGEPKFFPGPYKLEAGFLITRQPTGIGRPLLHLLPPSGSDTEAGFIVGEREEHVATAQLFAAAPALFNFVDIIAGMDADGGLAPADTLRALIRDARGLRAQALGESQQ